MFFHGSGTFALCATSSHSSRSVYAPYKVDILSRDERPRTWPESSIFISSVLRCNEEENW